MALLDRKTLPAAAAAGLEVLTGATLAVAPSLVARLLFGSEMDASGDAVGRIAGLVMLCLALGCFPRANGAPPVAPLLALSILAVIFLVIVGFEGGLVGVLLWPAAALHLVLAVLLAWAWMGGRGAAR